MKIIYLVVVSCILFFSNCSTKPKREDFVGVWKSKSGLSEINLNTDGSSSCVLEANFSDLKNDTIIQFEGQWKFSSTYYSTNQAYIVVWKGEMGFNLFVQGSGILMNKPPWTLFQYIGDPDDMELFELFKEN